MVETVDIDGRPQFSAINLHASTPRPGFIRTRIYFKQEIVDSGYRPWARLLDYDPNILNYTTLRDEAIRTIDTYTPTTKRNCKQKGDGRIVISNAKVVWAEKTPDGRACPFMPLRELREQDLKDTLALMRLRMATIVTYIVMTIVCWLGGRERKLRRRRSTKGSLRMSRLRTKR